MTLTTLPTGTDSLTAVYGGDVNFQGSTTAPVPFVVTLNGTLTVTAFNASRLYGVANPAFTYAISGFVNGDTQSVVSGAPSLTTTATTSSPDGTYPINAALGTLSAPGYNFAFVNGTLTISSAGAQPNIQGRWEFVDTSGDTPAQVAMMGNSGFSTYLLQSAGSTAVTNSLAFTVDSIPCDEQSNFNITVANSSIDTRGERPDYFYGHAVWPGSVPVCLYRCVDPASGGIAHCDYRDVSENGGRMHTGKSGNRARRTATLPQLIFLTWRDPGLVHSKLQTRALVGLAR